MSDHLKVFANREYAGMLKRLPDGGVIFEANPDSSCTISLAFGDADNYTFKNGLHPVFEQSLPEGALRIHIEGACLKYTKSNDDLTLLRFVGRSLIGRLRFGDSLDDINQVPSIDLSAVGNDNHQLTLDSLLDCYAQYSGIAGVQPKVLARDQESSNKMAVLGATHILKSHDERYESLPGIEKFCLDVTSRSGLTTPNANVSKDGKWINIERFDIRNGDFLAFEDFCSLAGSHSSGKYNGSYEQLSKVIRAYSSNPGEDLKLYYQMIVLSVLLRNGDAHRKNFAMVYENPDDARLAPAFDIVTTSIYPRLDDAMALCLNGSHAWPSSKKLKRFGLDHCLLTQYQIKDIHDKCLHALETSMGLINSPYIREEEATKMEECFKSSMKLFLNNGRKMR